MYRFYDDVIMFFESKDNFHRLEISKVSGDQYKLSVRTSWKQNIQNGELEGTKAKSEAS